MTVCPYCGYWNCVCNEIPATKKKPVKAPKKQETEESCKNCTDHCCNWQGAEENFGCEDWTNDPRGFPISKRKQEGPKMSVYRRIVEAYSKNSSINLSPKDVAILGSDLAIISMAETNSEARTHRCFSIQQGMPKGAKAGRCVGDGWWLCKNCSRYRKSVFDQTLDSRHAAYNQKITDLIKEFSEHEATTSMDGVCHLLARIFVRLDEL